MLSPAQKQFFETFGYLALPGLLAPDIGWIQDEFEATWRARSDIVHDGSQRTIFPESFINANARLSTLLEHPRIVGLCEGLLGDGYSFWGGDGNFYAGDTGWHSDNSPGSYAVEPKTHIKHLKVAFYLDRLTRDTGALRVIPGSHRFGDRYADRLHHEINHLDMLGIAPTEVPSVALDIVPGDIVCFNHRLKHAAFGGSKRRRMFTMNLFERCGTPRQVEANDTVFDGYWGMGCQQFFRPEFVAAASPERLTRIAGAVEFERRMQERGRARDAAQAQVKAEPSAA